MVIRRGCDLVYGSPVKGHTGMLALGCDMTSDDQGRACILEELLAADESQYRRAIARRYWLALPAGLFLDGQRPCTRGPHPGYAQNLRMGA